MSTAIVDIVADLLNAFHRRANNAHHGYAHYSSSAGLLRLDQNP